MKRKIMTIGLVSLFIITSIASVCGLEMKSDGDYVINSLKTGSPMWGDTEVASPSTSNQDCDEQSIALGPDDSLHIVWCYYPELMYAKKEKNGAWNTPIHITDNMENEDHYCEYTSISVDNEGTVHLVYDVSGEGLYYRSKSKNNPWSEKEHISGDETCTHQPAIDVDSDGTAHVSWVEGFLTEDWLLAYRQRNADGSWSDKKIIDAGYVHDPPSLDVDLDDNIHIAWSKAVYYEEEGFYRHHIFYIKKSANGIWNDIEVAAAPDCAIDPHLITDFDGKVHIVYEVSSYDEIYSDESDIYYSKRDNNRWQSIDITESDGDEAYSPYLSVDKEGTAHIVWRDCYGGLDSGISYRSIDANGDWGAIELVSTYIDSLDDDVTRYDTWEPQCIIDSENMLHVIWRDGTEYLEAAESEEFVDYDIFYRKRDLNLDTSQYHAPSTPSISGKNKGKPLIEYDFYFNSVDDDGDQLYYLIDWGDGQTGEEDDFIKEWIGPYAQGEEIKISHSWIFVDDLAYKVRCKTRDGDGFVSEWSDAYPIKISTVKSKNTEGKMFFREILEFLIEKNSDTFPLIELFFKNIKI